VNSVSTVGTDFAKAFQEVIETFDPQDTKKKETETEESGAARIAILFSDGENHEEGVGEGLELLKKKGIKLYTVTVGTEKGGLIPERDPRGFLTGYKKDKSGQIVNSTARYEQMRNLANQGGGAAFTGDLSGTSMKDLAGQLESLERGEFESEKRMIYDERFQVPLALALVLALLELGLSTRKPAAKFWRGRFEKSAG
jgi:Ca-activated chloride channel family protein